MSQTSQAQEKAKTIHFESSKQEPYPLQIVGESFHRQEISDVARHYDEYESVKIDDLTAQLILEDNNPDDANAVRVEIENRRVGHLSRTNAVKYRAALKRLTSERVIGECFASVRGGRIKDDGVKIDYGVRLDIDLENLQVARPLTDREQLALSAMNEAVRNSQAQRAADRAAAVAPAPVMVAKSKAAAKPQKRRTLGEGFYQALVKKHTWQEWVVILAVVGLIMLIFWRW